MRPQRSDRILFFNRTVLQASAFVLFGCNLPTTSLSSDPASIPDEAVVAWGHGVTGGETRSALLVIEGTDKNLGGGKPWYQYKREFVAGDNYKVEEYATLEDAANRINCSSVSLVNSNGSFHIGGAEDGNFFIAKYLSPAEHELMRAERPFDRGLILDLPYMAWTFSLDQVLKSSKVELEAWGEVEGNDGNLFQFVVRDISGEIKEFNNINISVDRSIGYRIVDLEADFVDEPERFKKKRSLTYNKVGTLIHANLETLEDATVLSRSGVDLKDIQTVIPPEEFSLEFYGLSTPQKTPPAWTSRHYVIIALVAVIAITLIVIKKRQATEATV